MRQNIKRAFGTLLACALGATSSLAETAERASDKIYVCKQGTLYALPFRSTGISLDGNSVIGKENIPYFSDDAIVWEPGAPTLKANEIYVRGVSELPPILDNFLGYEVQFRVSNILIRETLDHYDFFKFFTDEPSELPGFLRSKSSRSYIPEHLHLFGNPVIVWCAENLPVYSDDPRRKACRLRGLLRDGSPVQLDFNIGIDLTGSWPYFLTANETWGEPLQLLENAIDEIIVSAKDEGGTCN